VNTPLKIENFWEYLEAGFSESMRNSNFIHSDLSTLCQSTFSIFFTLETKGIGGGEIFSNIGGGKAAEDLENLLMAIVHIDLAQQNCDHSALC
jgi:hypothetical protein